MSPLVVGHPPTGLALEGRVALQAGDDALDGEVEVGTFILSGHFKGNIRANNRVELRRPARFEGSIETPVLVVEEGVVLNGSLSMGAKASGGASAAAAKAD